MTARPGRAIALLLALPAFALAASAVAAPAELTLDGGVKAPLHVTAETLKAMPPTELDVSFDTEHGPTKAHFTGVPLWTLIDKAGGLADPDKRAFLKHTLTITGSDGYVVVLSTGELHPEFGNKGVIVAYLRDGKEDAKEGLRLVVPGDKRGGRSVRDVVHIEVK
jgi:DMSO/TMAO reductase YedYZ molybdopterin-dependent catalytic subunit